MDILFLYRTPKKKNYFQKIKDSSPFEKKIICILSYNSFMMNLGFLTPMDQALADAHTRALEEVFYNRNFTGVTALKFLYSSLISIKIKTIHRGLKKYFKKNKPKKLVLWNGLKYQDLILKEVLKNHKDIQVYYMENGPLPNTTAIDKQGVNAGSSLSKSPAFYNSYSDETDLNVGDIKGRPYKNSPDLSKTALPKNYILLPFQMERDSQVLDYSPWVSSMEELFHTVFGALKKSDLKDCTLVVREHPSTTTTYKNLYEFSEHKNILFDKSTPLKEAIKKARCVVTINSSVGFESLLLDQKVIVLGTAFYDLEGLNLNAKNTRELVASFNQINKFKPDESLKSSFVSYLKNQFLIVGDWSKPTLEHFKSLSSKIQNQKEVH